MSGVKVVSYNIQFGRGMDRRIDLVRVCDSVRDADIICLQEVDQWWKRSGEVDQADEISSLRPGFYYVFGASFNRLLVGGRPGESEQLYPEKGYKPGHTGIR